MKVAIKKECSVVWNILDSFGVKGTNFIGLVSGISTWIMAHIDSVATIFGMVITVATGAVAIWSSIIKTNHQKRMNELEYMKAKKELIDSGVNSEDIVKSEN